MLLTLDNDGNIVEAKVFDHDISKTLENKHQPVSQGRDGINEGSPYNFMFDVDWNRNILEEYVYTIASFGARARLGKGPEELTAELTGTSLGDNLKYSKKFAKDYQKKVGDECKDKKDAWLEKSLDTKPGNRPSIKKVYDDFNASYGTDVKLLWKPRAE